MAHNRTLNLIRTRRRWLTLFILACAVIIGWKYYAQATPGAAYARQPGLDYVPASATPGCVPIWNSVSSPRPGLRNGINGVAVISASDIWAVGYYRPDVPGPSQTMITHWDGSQWSLITSPNVGTQSNILSGVAAISANDVWAVGFASSGPTASTLTLHWDGLSWSHVPSPSPGNGHSYLQGVEAVAPNDVWAVGDYDYPSSKTLTLHWDGTSWAHVNSPGSGLLQDVDAISSSDVWAVGHRYEGSGVLRTVTLHWDGTQWDHVPSPNIGNYSELQDVSAISAGDVWAVGNHISNSPYLAPLVMRWDGQAWSVIATPDVGTQRFIKFYGVEAISSNDVWIVGNLVLHWDGSKWTIVLSGQGEYDPLYDVAAVSANDVWAVGEESVTSEGGLALIKRYTGQCGTVTPTSSPTRTSTATWTPVTTSTGTPISTFTSTSTSIPTVTATTTSTFTPVGMTPTATRTPQATPTHCAASFSDVPEGSTFYPFVRCLVCLSVISGYADGTFKPGNDVTRGQISKIVANAAGFDEAPGSQVFEDVLPDSTFYVFIGRMAGRGIIGGYPCGGVGEPCGPDNKAYFRPNANATRGQISKIVSTAAAHNEPPVSQIFEDVTPSNSFYAWIQRLASRGIMGGYECGRSGEPCGSDNRPYFRPNANATRGQISKIVANTFFPSCTPPARE